MAQRLGEILQALGLVDQKGLDAALRRKAKLGGRVGEHLVAVGAISEEDLLRGLARQRHVPFADQTLFAKLDTRLRRLVPRSKAYHYRIVPVRYVDGQLILATCESGNLERVRELVDALGHRVRLVLASRRLLEGAIRNLYEVDSGPPPGELEEAAAPAPRRRRKRRQVRDRIVRSRRGRSDDGTEVTRRDPLPGTPDGDSGGSASSNGGKQMSEEERIARELERELPPDSGVFRITRDTIHRLQRAREIAAGTGAETDDATVVMSPDQNPLQAHDEDKTVLDREMGLRFQRRGDGDSEPGTIVESNPVGFAALETDVQEPPDPAPESATFKGPQGASAPAPLDAATEAVEEVTGRTVVESPPSAVIRLAVATPPPFPAVEKTPPPLPAMSPPPLPTAAASSTSLAASEVVPPPLPSAEPPTGSLAASEVVPPPLPSAEPPNGSLAASEVVPPSILNTIPASTSFAISEYAPRSRPAREPSPEPLPTAESYAPPLPLISPDEDADGIVVDSEVRTIELTPIEPPVDDSPLPVPPAELVSGGTADREQTRPAAPADIPPEPAAGAFEVRTGPLMPGSDVGGDEIGEPFGNYVLLRKIKTGGMAEVFEAAARGIEGVQRVVAIKRILPNLTDSQEFVEMFIDEAKIMVQLSHASIGQVYELGKVGDSYFIAMELVTGRDLNAIFVDSHERAERLPIPVATYIIQHVLEGLDYAHRKCDIDGTSLGIVHRDVSPANILCSFEGTVKIVDFGIAKAVSKVSLTRPGLIKGKISYMSPEQMRGREIDRRSDIFAAGIVLYEVLSGRRLFAGTSDVETIRNVLRGDVPPLRAARDEIPEDIAACVHRALERSPADRYQWAAEMSHALQRAMVRNGYNNPRGALVNYMTQHFGADIAGEE